MKILSIDPGFDRLGIAIIQKISTHEELLFSECFITNKKEDNYQRLYSISLYIKDIITKHNPEILFIESIFLFKNQKTIIDVVSARAIIINECKKNNIKIFELTPMQIKSAIAGHGHADKIQVEFMVKTILKNDKYLQQKILENKKIIDDEIDAIACGLAGIAYFKNIL